jgi:hypothetical protein
VLNNAVYLFLLSAECLYVCSSWRGKLAPKERVGKLDGRNSPGSGPSEQEKRSKGGISTLGKARHSQGTSFDRLQLIRESARCYLHEPSQSSRRTENESTFSRKQVLQSMQPGFDRDGLWRN